MGLFFLNMAEEMVLGYISVLLLLISTTAEAVGNSFPSTTHNFFAVARSRILLLAAGGLHILRKHPKKMGRTPQRQVGLAEPVASCV